jgi:hypothetical protein
MPAFVTLQTLLLCTASSLLRESAKRGYGNVIALLLSRGANVNAASVSESVDELVSFPLCTPILVSFVSLSPPSVTTQEYGHTALLAACEFGHTSATEALLADPTIVVDVETYVRDMLWFEQDAGGCAVRQTLRFA